MDEHQSHKNDFLTLILRVSEDHVNAPHASSLNFFSKQNNNIYSIYLFLPNGPALDGVKDIPEQSCESEDIVWHSVLTSVKNHYTNT